MKILEMLLRVNLYVFVFEFIGKLPSRFNEWLIDDIVEIHRRQRHDPIFLGQTKESNLFFGRFIIKLVLTFKRPKELFTLIPFMLTIHFWSKLHKGSLVFWSSTLLRSHGKFDLLTSCVIVSTPMSNSWLPMAAACKFILFIQSTIWRPFADKLTIQ